MIQMIDLKEGGCLDMTNISGHLECEDDLKNGMSIHFYRYHYSAPVVSLLTSLEVKQLLDTSSPSNTIDNSTLPIRDDVIQVKTTMLAPKVLIMYAVSGASFQYEFDDSDWGEFLDFLRYIAERR